MAKAMKKVESSNVDAFAGIAEVQKAGLQPLTDTSMPMSPYVQFAHNNAKNRRQYETALGARTNGDPVLVHGQEFTLLEPFKFIAMPIYHQAYCEFEQGGNFEIVGAIEAAGKVPDGYSEIIHSVIICVIGNDLIPARIRWRGPKCPAIKTAIKAITEEVEESDFPNRSKDHQKIAATKMPKWAWMLNEATIKPVPAKQGREAYELATATSKLVPFGVLATLMKLRQTEAFKTVLDDCIKDHKDMAKKIQDMIS